MFGVVSRAAVRGALISCVSVCAVHGSAFAQSLPTPWSATDVGSPELSGRAWHSSGVFRIDAAGADIWDERDEFHFVYQEIAGDIEIVARVDSLEAAHEWSKAGVMIRSSLDAGAAHGYALVSALGVHFQRRPTNGGLSTNTTATANPAPVWLRAIRIGERVTTYWSLNGTSWSAIGVEAIGLGSSAYVGIAVTSHDAGAHTRALVSNVRIIPRGLPAGQFNRDIGNPAISGLATHASGSYAVRAGGQDIWDRSDEFHFIYQPLTGSAQVTVRVASLTYADVWSKAGVMIRETLSADSRHAMMVVTPGNGYVFQRRHEPSGYSSSVPGGPGTAPGWLRLVRTGNRFDAYRSSNGSTWTLVGSDTVMMAETVYVGLAVTSHNGTTATDAVFDSYDLVTSTTTANQPPTVSITSPANGSSFSVLGSLSVTASASDPENRMAAVEFFAGSILIGRDTTAPYGVTWLPSTPGSYLLTAVAQDADGNVSVSSGVSVTFGTSSSITTVPRLVTFTASADHATNVTSYLFEVFANGANPSTATPVATSDLGKPAPSSTGAISVDRSTFFSGLTTGTYVSTVTAIGPGGRTRSAAVTFTR